MMSFSSSILRTGVRPACFRFQQSTLSLPKSMITRFCSNAARISGRQQFATKSRLYQYKPIVTWRQGVLYASSACAFSFFTSGSSTILCDAPGGRQYYSASEGAVSREVRNEESQVARLDYRELALGSFVGLFVGYLIGKFSRVFVFLVGSTFLFLQFLASRRVISLPYNRFYAWARKRYGNRELILENISFKISFGAAMIIAAANA
ncbi:hypothetical protein V1517DRAFT_316759 [Lipomyces orientalis]|uniref:Uncharacterized protein n=1 Tax=Lipomyces orientalis TaxID=1233043 RepID=A0ACC3TTN6_9ASCO